jgi:predicted CXXCH cytochrome family protein
VNFWAVIDGVTPHEVSPAHFRDLAGKLAWLLVCVTLLLCDGTTVHAITVVDSNTFNHMTTGFPLTGSHNRLECEDCHVGGVYEPLPTLCSACHDNVLAQGMPADHISTALSCDACHTTQGFLLTAKQDVDHSLFGVQRCIICHNNANAEGKSATHIASSDLCEACHVNRGWTPVLTVDHSQVKGSCYSCHDGTIATGQAVTHMPTTDACASCHEADAGIAWNTTSVDHSQVIGICSNCHDGVTATGKGPTHTPTTEECNSCHTTLNWIAAATADKRFIG